VFEQLRNCFQAQLILKKNVVAAENSYYFETIHMSEFCHPGPWQKLNAEFCHPGPWHERKAKLCHSVS